MAMSAPNATVTALSDWMNTLLSSLTIRRISKFELSVAPVAKARPRVTRNGTYTLEKTATATAAVRRQLSEVMARGRTRPFKAGTPLLAFVICYLPRPRCRKGEFFHVVRPDWDNLGKLVSDAANGVVWHDDSQVALGGVFKIYTQGMPRIELHVAELIA